MSQKLKISNSHKNNSDGNPKGIHDKPRIWTVCLTFCVEEYLQIYISDHKLSPLTSYSNVEISSLYSMLTDIDVSYVKNKTKQDKISRQVDVPC